MLDPVHIAGQEAFVSNTFPTSIGYVKRSSVGGAIAMRYGKVVIKKVGTFTASMTFFDGSPDHE